MVKLCPEAAHYLLHWPWSTKDCWGTACPLAFEIILAWQVKLGCLVAFHHGAASSLPFSVLGCPGSLMVQVAVA